MNFNQPIYMTTHGLEKIQEELAHLKTVRREEVAERLAVALSHGDLSENADYDQVKQEQAILEGRIIDLEDALKRAVIVEEDDSCDSVRVGSTVIITEDGWDEEERYRIVGVHEAAPIDGLISNESPIGQALLGAKVGDTVVALTPGGETRLHVLQIQ